MLTKIIEFVKNDYKRFRFTLPEREKEEFATWLDAQNKKRETPLNRGSKECLYEWIEEKISERLLQEQDINKSEKVITRADNISKYDGKFRGMCRCLGICMAGTGVIGLWPPENFDYLGGVIGSYFLAEGVYTSITGKLMPLTLRTVAYASRISSRIKRLGQGKNSGEQTK